MRTGAEIRLSLLAAISLCLHGVFFAILALPDYRSILTWEKNLNDQKDKLRNRFSRGIRRDIIVNINQDKRQDINEKTLLSDEDSTAKGFVTKKAGDQWLNNSRDFLVIKGGGKSSSPEDAGKQPGQADQKILLSDNSEVVVSLEKEKPREDAGKAGFKDMILIPDKYGVTRENAIYYSNSGSFSFNTAKFKNFKYFKKMKDSIASHWFPPLMANAVFGGYNPDTGGYAPGRVRIMAISSQEVRLYFIMDRDGEVVDVQIVDSYGNRSLDQSCIDAVRLSRNFGKVPEDIKGKYIMIPFIFGYFSN